MLAKYLLGLSIFLGSSIPTFGLFLLSIIIKCRIDLEVQIASFCVAAVV